MSFFCFFANPNCKRSLDNLIGSVLFFCELPICQGEERQQQRHSRSGRVTVSKKLIQYYLFGKYVQK